jgi:hypothetical protein
MTHVPVPRLSRLLAGVLLLLAALAAIAPSGAQAQAIENSGSWLESSAALAQGGDATGRRIRMTFLVSHAAGREVDKIALDKDWNGTDNTPTGGTIIDVTPQKPAGNFNYSRVDVTTDVSDGDLGGGTACIGDTPYKDRTVRARAILDNGTRSSVTVTGSLRTLRGDVNACNDYPYLYSHATNTPKQATPGESLTWSFKGDDSDSGLTGERDWTGYRWRWRRTNDGAVSGVTEKCGGVSDNSDQSVTTSLPSRGHYVIEAQLASGNGGSCNWKSEWNWIGAADVNTAAADSPTASLSIPRPNVNQTITATATLTDSDGAPQMVEWDANGDTTYERRELGTPAITTAMRQQTINTTGMSPGLHTVRVRARDNGALNGADDVARTVTATQTFRVDAIPVAESRDLETWEGDAIPVQFAATDADGDTLTYTIQTAPSHGTLTGSGTNRTYTPDAGYDGTDLVVYKVDDGFGGITTANVDITVHPDTEITSGPPSFTSQTSATFEFAPAPGLSFECKLDDGAYTACSSPQVYNSLEDADHTLTVRGIDSEGNRDATPAVRTWTVYTGALRTVFSSGPATFTSSDDATFAFTATIPGSTFSCQLDDEPAAPCATGLTYTDLDEGLHTLRVTATSGATVESPAQAYTWTVDQTAPQTTILSGPAADTNETTAELGFNSEAGASFECSLDGAAFTSCTSVQQYTSLGEGEHTFRVRATDQAGNVDPDPAERTWNVDTTAPGAQLDDAPSGDRAGDEETIAFSTGDANARLECSLDDEAFETCFSPHELSGLDDGPHEFRVRAVDAAGNTSGVQSATWTSDATAPDTAFTDGPTGAYDSADASFTFAADDVAATYECKLDTGTWQDCASPHAVSGAGDGAHTLAVRATDTAGNVEVSPAVRSWTVDTATPDVTVDAPPAARTNDTTPTFAFSSSDEAATFECRVHVADAATPPAFTACDSPYEPTVTGEDDYVLDVRAVDAAGNASTPDTVEWTLDTTAPVTSAVTAPASPTGQTAHAFTLGSSEAGTFECSLDGGPFQLCTSPRTVSGLGDGEHTFEVRAIDTAGNQGDVKTAFWTVNTAVASTQITDGPSGSQSAATARFRFASSKAGATFQCRLDGAASFTACVSGQEWSSLGQGQHTFRVKTTGSPDSAAAVRTWTVDSVAPDTRFVSGPPVSTSAQATFTFEATEANVAYECQLDGGAWKGCPNPHAIDIGVGSHTLAVRAIDEAGNADPSPTAYVWTVTAPGGPGATGQAASTNTPNPAGAASTSCTLAGGTGCKAPSVTGKLGKTGAVELTASGGSVALKAIDFTLPSGAALQFARTARGKQIGTLVLKNASGKAVATHKLTLPKNPKGTATLLSKSGVKVTLKAGRTPVLKVSGLPAGVVSATVKVNGGKRKLLKPVKGCTALKPTGKLTPQSGAARTLKGDAACGKKSTKKGGSK